MHNPSTCPSWCEREHSTDYIIHTRAITEFVTDSGLIVEITLLHHRQPGNFTPPVVRLITNTETDTFVADLPVNVAAHLGRVLTAMDHHPFGAALITAAATLLGMR
jgi:hypothetical protein